MKAPAPDNADHPLLALPREDLDLIAEFVLQSGSLKGLARAYDVSYPTIRNRLDKVIKRLAAALEGREPDPLAELLATLVQRGELTVGGARAIKETAREAASATTDNEPPDTQGDPS